MSEVSPQRRRIMQGNKSRDTLPELAVRRILHTNGLRYRVNYRPEPGLRRTADIVFTKAKVAVFIDGCFWHGCSEHAAVPSSNAEYWGPKLKRNSERDRDTDDRLTAAGWTVLRYWAHQDPDSVAREVMATLTRSRAEAPEDT